MAFSQNVTKLAAAVVAVVALVAIIDGAPVIVGAAASVSHGDQHHTVIVGAQRP